MFCQEVIQDMDTENIQRISHTRSCQLIIDWSTDILCEIAQMKHAVTDEGYISMPATE